MNRKTFLSTCLFVLSTPFTGISSILEKKDKWDKGIHKFYYDASKHISSARFDYAFKGKRLKFLIVYGNFNKSNYNSIKASYTLLLDDDRIYTVNSFNHKKSPSGDKYIEFEIV